MARVIVEHVLILHHLDSNDSIKALEVMRAHINSVEATIVRLRPQFPDYFVEG
jgi:DNA-binding GntR family transcriptional regulator